MIILKKLSSIPSSNMVISDPLLGSYDGANQTFTTSNEFDSNNIVLNYNGQELTYPEDFDILDSSTVQFIYITPNEEDVVTATYDVL